MRNDVEYYVYLTHSETGEYHHCHRGPMPESAALRARWFMKKLRSGYGTFWRNHHSWCDSVEVWEIHDGYHDERTGPDRRVAWARWDRPGDLAIVDDFAILREVEGRAKG